MTQPNDTEEEMDETVCRISISACIVLLAETLPASGKFISQIDASGMIMTSIKHNVWAFHPSF